MGTAIESVLDMTLEDGSRNEITLWSSVGQSNTLFFLLPAMGVRASYYNKFCAVLADSGVSVAAVDWRGHDRSSIRAGRKSDWGYSRLIQETQYYVNWLKKKFDFENVYFIGHSMGGQVGHLTAARYPELIDGVFSVASSDPYYKMWKGQGAFAVYLAGMLVYPLSVLVGHFPGYVFRFAKRESRTLIRDWGYAVRNGKFKPRKDDFDYTAAKSVYPGRIIAISIADDFFAPKIAADFTIDKFQNASVNQHYHLEPRHGDNPELDHFNWVKYPDRVIELILENF